MLRLLPSLFLALLFAGCSMQAVPDTQDTKPILQKEKKSHVQVTPNKHKSQKIDKTVKQLPKMFQTVNADEATLVQSGEHNKSCAICGMNLVKFYKTSHMATQNNKKIQFCSIHCLAEYLDEGNELKNPMVVDAISLKMIPVLEANYVVGSRVKGTMSRVSKYAFKNLEDAKAFQAENGGKIVDFHTALDIAREDFN